MAIQSQPAEQFPLEPNLQNSACRTIPIRSQPAEQCPLEPSLQNSACRTASIRTQPAQQYPLELGLLEPNLQNPYGNNIYSKYLNKILQHIHGQRYYLLPLYI